MTLIGTNPTVLVVNQTSPYKTLKDVLAAGKAKTGALSSALGRQRHLAAPGAGAAELQVGREVHARAVQGQRPGHAGRDRRPGRHDVRHHRGRRRRTSRAASCARIAVTSAKRAAEPARSCRPLPRAACRLRRGVVAGDLRARGHAEADRRPAARRDHEDPRRARGAGAPEELRHAGLRHDDRADRRVPEGRGGEVGAGDQERPTSSSSERRASAPAQAANVARRVCSAAAVKTTTRESRARFAHPSSMKRAGAPRPTHRRDGGGARSSRGTPGKTRASARRAPRVDAEPARTSARPRR